MRSLRKTIGITLLCLGVLSWQAGAQEERLAVQLDAPQKAFVLGHMREMLEALTDTQRLLLEGKKEEVAVRISQLMNKENSQRPRGLGKQLPPAFRAMSQSMHPYWTALQEPDLSAKEIQQNVVDVMQVCNACHRTFAIQ